MASDGPETSAAPATENLIPPSVNDDKLIKCQPGENESDIIEVPFKQIKQSHTFHNMFRDLGCDLDENFVFPMPAVKPDVFQKVVEWTANHIGVPDPEVKEDPTTRERVWFTLNDYENKFFDVPVDITAELLTAANYLDIKHLYLYGCQKMAELIKSKTPEEIRELLGLEDDLTPEEKEEIKKQNVWCNY
ncbi:skp1 family, dimerization domain-containing protein [Ditylenchus destructor]|uniref:Skp1-related protein n=1 Tax=Ditylenchus destructor TaxID=166010 RepID=A0AAD4N867_9BILA|nr:skp1 family, dimerization domain-containing protein [Ditylenchus destructor]